MAIGNTRTAWGAPARLLHWLVAALILFQLGLGVWMVNVVSDVARQFALYQTHKSWGFVIFSLAVLRILWRTTHRAPDFPAQMSTTETVLARGAHLALYILMIAMPITGWLQVSASTLQEQFGIRNTVFGLFELPDPFQPGSKSIELLLRTIHNGLAVALALILAGHVAAALWHHFVRRDAVLRRMVLGR